MATLTNPVNKQNLVDRFSDFVVATANAGIAWGTDAIPFPELPASTFGGTTAGRAIGISGATIGDTTITAETIRAVLETETATYTNIRNLRAILYVTGTGGNTGTRPTAGYVFDKTAKSNLNTGYRSALPAVDAAGVTSGNTVSAVNLETYFSNLQAAYASVRDTASQIRIDVCHASCHSSCHSSRGRR